MLSIPQAVEELYSQGLDMFPTSALLNVYIAGYVQHHRGNRHVEYLHLKAAAVSVPCCFAAFWQVMLGCSQAKNGGWDVRYAVHARREEIREEEKRQANGVVSTTTRVKFDELKLDVEDALILTHERLVEFWTELAHKQPSLDKLHSSGLAVQQQISEVDKCYAGLLEMNPSSVLVMREYADFLMKVWCSRQLVCTILQKIVC
jgi:hypothetical protein